MSLISRLDEIEKKYREVAAEMESEEVLKDHRRLRDLNKQYKDLSEIVFAYSNFKKMKGNLESLNKNLEDEDDEEMKELIEEEIGSLNSSIELEEKNLQLLLVPKDPNDDKDVMIEIRAGTGGEEAAIFAADLYRMYTKFAEGRGWKVDSIDHSDATAGGFKEIIFSIKGKNAFRDLKFESGVHRVQRIPKTETSGRIHTSTATVAVLVDAEDIEVEIENKDLRIETFRSSGAGGQHVNTTDSAVRITHIPSGVVVSCQDGRSQLKNREKAMAVLKSRIYAAEQKRVEEERSQNRKQQVGTGGRSEKIRTYNFPQGRLTDHRIGLTVYTLDRVMDGEISEIVRGLQEFDQAMRLKEDVR